MYLPFLLTLRLGVRVLEVMRAAPHLRLLGVLCGEIWGESVDMRSEPPSLVDSAPLSEEESEDVSAVPSPSRGVVFQIRRAANGRFCLVTRVGARISSLVGPDSIVSLVTEAGAPALVGIRVVRGVPMPTGGPAWSTSISVPTGVSMFGVTPSGTMLKSCATVCGVPEAVQTRTWNPGASAEYWPHDPAGAPEGGQARRGKCGERKQSAERTRAALA